MWVDAEAEGRHRRVLDPVATGPGPCNSLRAMLGNPPRVWALPCLA